MMSWHEIKVFLEHSSGISMDSIHVMVGVVIQLVAAALSRRSVGNLLPWFVVLGLELANEVSDLLGEHWPDRALQYSESAKDIFLTLLLPTVLLIAVRYCPRIFLPRSVSARRSRRQE